MSDQEKAPFRDEAERLKAEYRAALKEVRNRQKLRFLESLSQSSSFLSAPVSSPPVFSNPVDNFGLVVGTQSTDSILSTLCDAPSQFAWTAYPSQYTFDSPQDCAFYPVMPQDNDEQMYADLYTTYLQSYPSSPSVDASASNFDITLAAVPDTNYQFLPLYDSDAAGLGVAPSYIACEDAQPGFGGGMGSPSFCPTFDLSDPTVFGWESLFGGNTESGWFNAIHT